MNDKLGHFEMVHYVLSKAQRQHMATRFITSLSLFLLAAVAAFAEPNGKLSPDLLSTGAEKIDVIIQFNAPPGQSHLNSVNGGELKKNLPAIDGAVFSMPAKALKGLANNPRIKYVSPDRNVFAALDYAAPTVGGDVAESYGYDGSGVSVAVIDSGIANDSAVSARVVHRETFISGKGKFQDFFGHGTHVSAIIAGGGVSGTGSEPIFRGIAPKANLVQLKVLNGEGLGYESAVIAAIERAISLKNEYNIRILNLSLGRPVFESFELDPLCQAVEAAWRAGITVVVAAGNRGRDNSTGTAGYATISSPANDPLVITVGAMKTKSTLARSDDEIASYSSKGPTLVDHVVKPDIVAPGNRIISEAVWWSHLYKSYPQNLIPESYYLGSNAFWDQSYDYFKLSGTSMAAPMVSGAAALLLEKEPELTPDQVKARLMKTASKAFPATSIATDPVTGETFVSQYDIFTVGAGYLDIQAALASNELAPAGLTAESPQAVYDPDTGEVFLVFGDSAMWGTSALWGTSSMWGTNAVWGTNVLIEADSAIWGTSALWGTSAMWGSETTEGFSAIWGTSVLTDPSPPADEPDGSTGPTKNKGRDKTTSGDTSGTVTSAGQDALTGDVHVMIDGEE